MKKTLLLLVLILTLFCTTHVTAATEYIYLYVPIVKQPTSSSCWAACSSSVLIYKGQNYTPQQVASIMGHDINQGLDIINVATGLASKFSITSTVYRNIPTIGETITMLRTNKTMIMALHQEGKDYLHFVVLDGYNDGGNPSSETNVIIRYMDPYDGKYYTQSYYSLLKGRTTIAMEWLGGIKIH